MQAMSELIEPRVLKGFRDTLPEAEISRRSMEASLSATFESFGFLPIDTPVLEYAEVLLGKGGGETDKQVYRFLDHGKRDVAMRYDLTVPFARFVAAHRAELPLPFKRYHIAKVWRGENTQKGRFREFYQCDFDIVGVDSASADLEILLMMAQSMRALGIQDFRIHLSHRGVFTALLDRIGGAGRAVDVLRTVDKLGKIGPDQVRAQLGELLEADQVERVMGFVTAAGTYQEILGQMETILGGADQDTERLATIRESLAELGEGDTFLLDPSITRGLDYYTGIVFETFLSDFRAIGSVCSGGRYNDLTTIYSKERMPGVGASIGLDRLHAALLELGRVDTLSGRVDVLVMCLDERFLAVYHRLARSMRSAGLAVEVYPERTKLPRQFQFAEKKGIPFAIICGEDEVRAATYIIKDLASRENYGGIPEDQLATRIRRLRG